MRFKTNYKWKSALLLLLGENAAHLFVKLKYVEIETLKQTPSQINLFI